MPCGCSVSARPSNKRSVVRNVGNAISGLAMRGARRSWWRSPDSLKSTASIRQPERSASSTRRTPSTPTEPDSVGRPPRSARRNSLSQRLSRLVRTPGAAAAALAALRADLPGVAIKGSVANFEPLKVIALSVNSRSQVSVKLQHVDHLEDEVHGHRPADQQGSHSSFAEEAQTSCGEECPNENGANWLPDSRTSPHSVWTSTAV